MKKWTDKILEGIVVGLVVSVILLIGQKIVSYQDDFAALERRVESTIEVLSEDMGRNRVKIESIEKKILSLGTQENLDFSLETNIVEEMVPQRAFDYRDQIQQRILKK